MIDSFYQLQRFYFKIHLKKETDLSIRHHIMLVRLTLLHNLRELIYTTSSFNQWGVISATLSTYRCMYLIYIIYIYIYSSLTKPGLGAPLNNCLEVAL